MQWRLAFYGYTIYDIGPILEAASGFLVLCGQLHAG